MEAKIEDHKTDCTPTSPLSPAPQTMPVEPKQTLDEPKPTEQTVEIHGKFKVINGTWFNDRGYEICGVMNQHNKPCQRIGTCPFHPKNTAEKSTEAQKQETKNSSTQNNQQNTTTVTESDNTVPIKQTDQDKHNSEEVSKAEKLHVDKKPFKQGWTKEEHLLFLQGLEKFGKGSWKEIAQFVGTRNATQIQSHAQKYFLRQEKPEKSKRSIHDYSLEDLEKMLVVRAAPQTHAPQQIIQQHQPMIQYQAPPPQQPIQQHMYTQPSQFYNMPSPYIQQQPHLIPAPMVSIQPTFSNAYGFQQHSSLAVPPRTVSGNAFTIPPISELKSLAAPQSTQNISLPSIRVLEESIFRDSMHCTAPSLPQQQLSSSYTRVYDATVPPTKGSANTIDYSEATRSSNDSNTFPINDGQVKNPLYKMDKKRPYPFTNESANNSMSFKYRAHNFKG